MHVKASTNTQACVQVENTLKETQTGLSVLPSDSMATEEGVHMLFFFFVEKQGFNSTRGHPLMGNTQKHFSLKPNQTKPIQNLRRAFPYGYV